MDRVTIRVQKALNGIGTVELAHRAGVSRYSAWRWESGRHPVGVETARKLERALFSGNGARPDGGKAA